MVRSGCLMKPSPPVGSDCYVNVVHSRKPRKGRAGGYAQTESEGAPDPDFGLHEIEAWYSDVQTIRAQSRLLSDDERALRDRLTEFIKHKERQLRRIYDSTTCSELRRARQIRDRLNGIPGPAKAQADHQLVRDWSETRDYRRAPGRRAMPRVGVSRIVSGGSPASANGDSAARRALPIGL